jgi:hypothetical protein
VALVFFLTLPGLVVGLTALAMVDRLGWWVSGRSRLPWFRDGRRLVSAVGLDELQAMFYSGKRHSIERRDLELVLRDDEGDGAPPRVRVDLDAGRAVITRPAADRSRGQVLGVLPLGVRCQAGSTVTSARSR